MNTEHAQRVVDFQEIRRVPLTAVLEYVGALSRLKRVGSGTLVGGCPICGGKSRKKFTVSFTKTPQLWKCFDPAHNSGGDALTFVSEYENVDITEAGRLIARWFAIGTDRTPSSQQARRRRRMSESNPNRPTHKVYSASKREGQKDFLTRIGSAWPFSTKDKRTGLNIQLTAMPIGERMVLFEYDAEEDAQEKADEPSEKKGNGRRK